MSDGTYDLDKLIALVRQTGARWTPGVTPLVELSVAEKKLRLGAEPPAGAVSLEERETRAKKRLESDQSARAAKTSTAPAAFDWRNVGGANFITDVQNQRNCGSCVAFGSIAAVEGALRIKRNDPNLAVDLSEAHLFYCHAAAEGRNCANGWVDPALNAFRDIGVVDEGCFPYTAGDQGCKPCADWQNRVQKISSWQLLNTSAEMKDWLSTKGPLAACFTVYDDFYAYTSGVYEHKTGERLGGHCICVTGYSDADSCWICKNSWGTNWGEQGYFRIAYGDCGIDYSIWGVEVPVTDTGEWLKKKLITGLWTVNQDRTAAAYIDGVGWRKVWAESDSVFAAMVTLLASAKTSNSPVNLRLEGEVIKEVYVF